MCKGESSVVVFKIPGVFRDFHTALKLLQRGKNYMKYSLTLSTLFDSLIFDLTSPEIKLNSAPQPNYIDYV